MYWRSRKLSFPSIVVLNLLLASLIPSEGACQSSSLGTGIQSLYISGFVRIDDTQEPLRAVTVTLRRGSGGDNVSPSVVSGTNGEFQFNNVLSGDYRIEVSQKGYLPASMSVMLGGTPLTNVMVNLQPEKASQAFEDLAVSTHQLSVPDKARDAYVKGLKFLSAAKPDYNRALAQFQRAIDAFSTYYESYAEMSIAYYHLGQTAEAEQALRKSIALSANQYADAIFLLAEMLVDENRFAEAEPVARDGIRLSEKSWRSYLALARAQAGMKHTADAEVSATKASELKPDNPEVFLVLGNIHIQQHNYAAVIRDFDTFLKLEPTGARSNLVRQSQEQARQALLKTQAHNNPLPHGPDRGA